jgi:hypothetical protein
MSRRGVGVVFIAIAAFFFGIRFLAAAIFGSNVSTWNGELFQALLQYVDQGLTPVSVVSLFLGVVYLVWAELSELKEPRQQG